MLNKVAVAAAAKLVEKGEDRHKPWKAAVAAELLKQAPHRSRSQRQ
jgi:hypothetical protein